MNRKGCVQLLGFTSEPVPDDSCLIVFPSRSQFYAKVMIWRVFLTVVVCWDVQNAAFTNQSG